MKAFEYAMPCDEAEVLEFLSTAGGKTEVLAGGTDLLDLMKKMIVTPDRVVSLEGVASLRVIDDRPDGVWIGVMATLDELLDSPELEPYWSLKQAIASIDSQQLRAQGTLGGELCHKPRCWYYRAGHGLLARGGRAVAEGDNRYHAIFGNAGAAKFVSASRLAPALIALGGSVRVIGPEPGDESLLRVEDLFRTPRHDHENQTVLQPGQIVTHVLLPKAAGWTSAAYDVLQGSGPDYPLASAAAGLFIQNNVIAEARVVLGQVAPVPWLSSEAVGAVLGRTIDQEVAAAAGDAAVASATPLSHNRYKVQLARVAVKRAVLLAAGLDTGGF